MAKDDNSKSTSNTPAITSPLGTGLFGVPNITGVSGLGGGADAGNFYDPEELKYLRQYVDALQEKQSDKGGSQLGPLYGPNNTPHFTWSQGVSNMLNALRGQQLLNQLLQNRAGGKRYLEPLERNAQDPGGALGGAPPAAPFTGAGQPPASVGGAAPSSQMLPPATVPGQPPTSPPGPSPAGTATPPPVIPYQWNLPPQTQPQPPPGSTGVLSPQGNLTRPGATAGPGNPLALGEGLPPFDPAHPLETTSGAGLQSGRGGMAPLPPPSQGLIEAQKIQPLPPPQGGPPPDISRYMPQTAVPLGRGRVDLMNQSLDPRPNAAPQVGTVPAPAPTPPTPTPAPPPPAAATTAIPGTGAFTTPYTGAAGLQQLGGPPGAIQTPPPPIPTPGMPTPPPSVQPSGAPPQRPNVGIDPTQFLAGNKQLPGGWSPGGLGPSASLATPLSQGFATQQVPPAPNIETGQSLMGGLSPIPGGIDRSTVATLLQSRPDLVQRLGQMTLGEVGRGAPASTQMAQTETALNRLAERPGSNLDQILWDTGQHGKQGYYPPQTFRQPFGPNDLETFKSNILPQVLAGSDYSAGSTGNASGDVSARQYRYHPEQHGFSLPIAGGSRESYFREPPYNTPFPRNPSGPTSVNQPPAPKLPTPMPSAQPPGAGMLGTHPNIPMTPFPMHMPSFMPMMGMGFGGF